MIKLNIEDYKQVLIGDDPWSEAFKEKLRNSPHYKTLELWKDNIDINPIDTPYYKWLYEILSLTGEVWGGIIKSKEDIIKQYEKFKYLYSIAPNWENQNIVCSNTKNNKTYFYGDKTVRISDDGTISLFDGNHRANILLFLNLPISVIICERSVKWQKLQNEFEKLYNGKKLYHPIPHPDFSDWKSNKEDYSDLRKILINNKINKILDLGICHGYTLYMIRDIIKEGIGIESHPIRFKIANMVLKKLNFLCYKEDIVTFLNIVEKQECILLLNVLHHLMRKRTKEDFIKLLNLISEKTDMLIYSLPNEHEPQYQWMYEDERNDIHTFIKENTKFTIQEISESNKRKMVTLK